MIRKITMLLIVFVFAFSCVKQTSNSPSKSTDSDSNSTSVSGGGSSGGSTTPPPPIDTGCYASGVGDQPSDYYTLTPIIFHGNKEGRSYYWSSATAPAMSQRQNNFVTDSRFSVRVLVKSAPSRFTDDAYGTQCYYSPVAYTKLKVTVGVRLPTVSGYTHQYTFQNINVDGCSEVYEFSDGRHPETTGPISVDIIDAKWDHSCNVYTQAGYPDVPECTADNGMSAIWPNDCVQLELQVATDYTKDIPH